MNRKKPAAKKPAAKKPAAKKPAKKPKWVRELELDDPTPAPAETPNEFIARTSVPRLRGAARMREFGYRQVVVWFDPSEFKTVEDASIRRGQPVATFVRKRAHVAALEVLFPNTAEKPSAEAHGQK